MPKATPIQTSFNAGEWSPLMEGRIDLAQHENACSVLENFLPKVQGPAVRRSGTKMVAEVKDNDKKSFLIGFRFSTIQPYILEFSEGFIRFFKDHGQIEDGGSPYEIAAPYTEEELFELRFAQSADVLYITHPNHKQRQLSRTGDTSWTLTETSFFDGPYLKTNTTDTTLIASSGSGNVTVTASAIEGINNGEGFKATDVGRMVRIKSGSKWAWGVIFEYVNTTQVNVEVKSDTNFPTSTTKDWRLGVWAETNGFPAAVTFTGDRLTFGGGKAYPQRIDMSVVGDYVNFQPTDEEGTVADDDAASFTLNASEVNNIQWLTDDERALLAGTAGAEWVVTPSSLNEAITPTNVNARRPTASGSANVQAMRVNDTTLYVQRTGRVVERIGYVFEADGFRTDNLTLMAEHIAEDGIVQIAHQGEPDNMLWAVRADGVLLSLTYKPSQEANAWARHLTDGEVESVSSIPSPDGKTDEIWLVVKRTINGVTKRYVEYMQPEFRTDDKQEDAVFVDSALTFDGRTYPAVTLTPSATEGENVTFTASGPAFNSGMIGDYIKLYYKQKITAENVSYYVDAEAYAEIKTFTSDTVVECDIYKAFPNTNAIDAGGWELRNNVTTISNLDHLEGKEVQVFADGGVRLEKTVTAGAIDIGEKAAVVHIGLPYQSRLTTMNIEAGAADGTAQGKKKRINRIHVLLRRTFGGLIGSSPEEGMDTIKYDREGIVYGDTPPLYDGFVRQPWPNGHEIKGRITIMQTEPLPMTILALIPQLNTKD